jgi:hypothetical protein
MAGIVQDAVLRWFYRCILSTAHDERCRFSLRCAGRCFPAAGREAAACGKGPRWAEEQGGRRWACAGLGGSAGLAGCPETLGGRRTYWFLLEFAGTDWRVYGPGMVSSIEVLEQRIESLRTQVRQALMAGDRTLATALRRELRQAERDWDEALDLLAQESPSERSGQPDAGAAPRPAPQAAPPTDQHATGQGSGQQEGTGGTPLGAPSLSRSAGSPGTPARALSGGLVLPLREQVYQVLTLLTVPAAPRLISSVHEAFFSGVIFGARLTSLRRDEERSFRIAPFARPYYICAALTADLLAPARGLLAVSTWPLERRVIGPLSPRVDFLTAAIQVAEQIESIADPSPLALRLLWRFATNIPGGADNSGEVSALAVARAAHAERGVHADADMAARRGAAARARAQLDDAQQLFGTRLRVTPRTGTAP